MNIAMMKMWMQQKLLHGILNSHHILFNNIFIPFLGNSEFKKKPASEEKGTSSFTPVNWDSFTCEIQGVAPSPWCRIHPTASFIRLEFPSLTAIMVAIPEYRDIKMVT